MVTTRIRRLGLVLAGLMLPAGSALAQASAKALKPLPPNTNVAVRLSDGSQVYGRLERLDDDSLIIVSLAGRQAYPVGAVKAFRDAGVAHKRADGSMEFWYPNANTTRLFFGPTGRTLNQGEGYFADHWVFLGSVSIGLTDRVQMGGGTFIIPNSEFWYLLPKVGIIRSENFNVAAGALYGGVGEHTGGIAYIVGTYGSADRSLTVGLGQGLSGDKVAGEPVFMLGGEYRTSRRTALVTENYFGTGFDGGGLMYGIRFLGDKFTFDFALMNSTTNLLFPGIPYIDFVFKW
jgi:hypothetical protein